MHPKLLTVLREGYTRAAFRRDATAGVIVGIVALPLSIALGIASGVRPEQGLYTAIVAGFLISALGGSRVQIGGPTGAFVVLVLEIVRQYGYDGLAAATILAGAFLIVMGATGLGGAIRFIPYPVTVGFTSGIALLIFSTQIPDALGLPGQEWPGQFIERWSAYAAAVSAVNPWAVGIATVTVLIGIYWRRVSAVVPGSLVAIILTSLVVQLAGIPVETIQSRLGEVPNVLPSFRLPHVGWSQLRELISPAMSIALLAGIESLLSAVVADGMIGGRHRSDTELVAQGIANIASPLFGGIPATGAIARTATNVKSGGLSPISGMVHALTLLLILLFLGKWAALIPMASLAGILVLVAYNMSEWHLFLKVFRSTRSDVAVLSVTFLLTVLADLSTAIQFGVVLASLLFMLRMSKVTEAVYITDSLENSDVETEELGLAERRVPDGVEVFEINGPFFFGAADRFKDTLAQRARKPKVLILRMRHVPVMDSTGLRALEDVVQRSVREGTAVILSAVAPQPKELILRSGLLAQVGEANFVGDIEEALERARRINEPDVPSSFPR